MEIKIDIGFIVLLGILVFFSECERKATFCREIDAAWVHSDKDTVIGDSIMYHPVRLDEKGVILPWYSSNLGQSYDTVIKLVWDFWNKMELDSIRKQGNKNTLTHLSKLPIPWLQKSDQATMTVLHGLLKFRQKPGRLVFTKLNQVHYHLHIQQTILEPLKCSML
jgi:hypothetical protein